MPIQTLPEVDREIVRRCLVVAASGELFGDDELHTLIGLDRAEVRALADDWPPCDSPGSTAELAINNCLLNLIGYPHSHATALEDLVGADAQRLEQILDAVRAGRELPLRISAARWAGKVVCAIEKTAGAVPPRAAADTLMRGHRLRALNDGWKPIGWHEAIVICANLLHFDLAYGDEIMSGEQASALARELLDSAGPSGVFFTNASWPKSPGGLPDEKGAMSWTPATNATFDAGVVGIGPNEMVLLWVEDED